MRDGKRAKGNAAGHKLVHSDVDSGELDPYEVEQLGGFVIGSGTLSHGHVYIPLTYAVTEAQHELLCKGLAAHLGGDAAKVSDQRSAPTATEEPAVALGATVVPAVAGVLEAAPA